MSGRPTRHILDDVNHDDLVGAPGGGVGEAPSDDTTFGRLNRGWTRVLPLGGGELSGPLNLPNGSAANPGLQLGAADGTGISRSANALVLSVQGATVMGFFGNAGQLFQPLYMLNNRIQQVGDPTAAGDAMNLRTGDARYLQPLVGGFISGPLQILTTPVVPNDAANKLYVDNAIAGAVSADALRSIVYTPNEITVGSAPLFFLDINFPMPAVGLRTILVTIDPMFASNDPQGSVWQLYYGCNLLPQYESTMVAYKFSNEPTSMFRATAKFAGPVDVTASTVRVLLTARTLAGSLIQVGLGGTIAPSLRTLVTIQDLGPA